MSRIVMVHGAGNDLWGPSSIKAKWLPALADGLAWHGGSVDGSDVTVAFYGDVFRGDPQEGYEPPVDQAAVGPDTTVLVAHSLGTLVAYEALCLHPEWGVTDFVTIGCPLAADLIHARLEPCPSEGGQGCWPPSVLAWTNIADPADPAAGSRLAGRFDGTVTEYKVDNGHRVHDPEPYLNNRWTGQAVHAGLTRQ